MADFKHFKSLTTGKTGRYPAQYEQYEDLVEIDPETSECIGCKGQYAELNPDSNVVHNEEAYYDYGNDTEIEDAE